MCPLQDGWDAVLVQVACQVGQVEQHCGRELVHDEGQGELGLQSQTKVRQGHHPETK